MALKLRHDELMRFDLRPSGRGWMDTKPEFRKGTYCFSGVPKHVEYVEKPNPREWQPDDDDWKLPENWEETRIRGFEERLSRFRSFKLFMDICVRCGACADKCHYFIGSGDPKNMPVLRAELIRSVYRKRFTAAGKLLGRLVGARDLDEAVLREGFYYFYQCTECRR